MADAIFCHPISNLNIHRIRNHVFPEVNTPQEVTSQMIEAYCENNRDRFALGTLSHQEAQIPQWDSTRHHTFQLKIHVFTKKSVSPLG